MNTKQNTRAAVIGAGFGGLAAAIRLQGAGIPTVLFERHDRAGGRASVFEQDGHTFDMGPTVITVPECLEELYELADQKLSDHIELLPIDPFYRLQWLDGDSFDYGTDMDRMLAQIEKRDPRDKSGYQRFLDYSRKNYEAGYVHLVSEPFLKFRDMLKVAPKLMRLRADRPVYRSVARFIKDERLRQAFTFHTLLIGGNPFATSSIYTLIHYLERSGGVYFPRGGTHALVRALVDLFKQLGGEVHLSTPVTRIEVEGDRQNPIHHLHTAEGRQGPFRLTVSNADLHHTYATLLGHDRRAARMRKRLQRMHWSMSLFVVYFGVNRTYDNLAHHTIIFADRYKSLLKEIFHGDRLPEDFSLYLHAPSVTDPSLAPAGGSSFYVLSPVPHLGHADPDWDTRADSYADAILETLERFLPDLRKHITVQKTVSPLYFENALGAHLGNGFSVAPTLMQSAYFRPHNRDKKIFGLYIAGAGTHPGAGVPGVINSAKATASVIFSDLGIDPKSK
jgi:phytoene desaturase